MLNSKVLLQLFQQSPTPSLVLSTESNEFNVLEVNQAYLSMIGLRMQDLVGKNLVDTFHNRSNGTYKTAFDQLKQSLIKTLNSQKPDQLLVPKKAFPLALGNEFDMEEGFWNILHTPLIDETGNITQITQIVHDVNENANTQQQSLGKEQHYHSLFWHNPDAIFSFDLEGKFIDANPASVKTAETTREHLLEITFVPLIPEKDRERVYANFLKATQGETVNYTTGFISVKGTEKILSVTNMPIIYGRKIIGVYGVAKDITEKIKAEEALSQERLLLKTLIDNIPDYIFVKDRSYRHLINNKANLELIGESSNEATIGKTVRDYFDQETAEAIMKDDQTVMIAGKSIINREEKLISPSREELWLLTSKIPLRDPKGKIIGLVGISRDITQIKSKAQHLKLLESVAKNTRDSVLIMEAELTEKSGPGILYVNEAFTKLTGYSESEVIGKTPLLLQGPQTDRKELDRMETAMKSWQPCEIEVINYKKNREEFWNHISINPVADETGNYTHWIAIQRDITSHKEHEASLNLLNRKLADRAKELADSNAELEQFAYIASHDLQEPLRMITGFLGRLEKKYEDVLDEKGKKYISFAMDGAVRMRQIILDLLEFSRVGRSGSNLESIDLNEIIAGIKILQKNIIEKSGAKITHKILPHVFAEKINLQQIFQNLINNTLKYRKKDQKTEIRIDFEDKGTHWQFSVKDNGIGIDPSYQDKIFAIFQRLHTREEYSGTGIGLAICKKIVENYSGKIWVESKVSEGSTFYFTLKKLQPAFKTT